MKYKIEAFENLVNAFQKMPNNHQKNSINIIFNIILD